MNTRKKINKIRARREHRVRRKICGTAEKPRLSIFRSNKYTYAQLIDDSIGKTIISVSSHAEKESKKGGKLDKAEIIGKIIAEKAKKAGISNAIVDRGAYRYHGRVKALVESARKAGLNM
ncbi:MAG: 50S ribosomal protein L18 [Patescibacteria group bacterium]